MQPPLRQVLVHQRNEAIVVVPLQQMDQFVGDVRAIKVFYFKGASAAVPALQGCNRSGWRLVRGRPGWARPAQPDTTASSLFPVE
jgi:hypothetical protein